MSTVEQALLDSLANGTTESRAYMVVSDLCRSTTRLMRDFKIGVALQAAHERLCSEASDIASNNPAFKAMGDGVWMEIIDVVRSCRIALTLLDRAHELRSWAEAKTGASFQSAKGMLRRKGFKVVKTVALLKAKAVETDVHWLEAENALLPWQFKPGYDDPWPTYKEGKEGL